MTADKNFYLKSPEELDLDFLAGMILKEELDGEFLLEENNNKSFKQNNSEFPQSADQHYGSGLNPKTELLTDEDEDIKKLKEINNKKKIPL